MSTKVRILALIPTLNDDPTKTVQSILNQSVEVSKIIVVIGGKELYKKLAQNKLERTEYVYVKPDFSQPLGKRVGTAINTALYKVNLNEYDYILKVDSEITLPKDFVEKNIQGMPDFVGSGGAAMLFKTNALLNSLGGKYPEVPADDTYLASKFLYEGYTVKRWRCYPQSKKREKYPHSYKHCLQRGIELYKLGYEPVHVLHYPLEFVHDLTIATFSMYSFFPVIGYFIATLRRTNRYEFARWIFLMQVRRIIFGRQFKY
ncbi:MAG: glycosyltransferase family A protein [Candidatus Bathyarchaeia archaeon]